MEHFWLLVGQAQEQASILALVALPLLIVRLLSSKGNFHSVLRASVASSARVNLITYAVDLVLIAGPLALLLTWMRIQIERGGWTLVPPAFLEGMPSWSAVVIAVFVGDGIAYFRHRLEHSSWLWPSHSLHHSDESMNVLTTLRFHPINRLTTSVIDLGLLLFMGFPAPVALASLAVRHVYGIFVHANVPWTLGPLGWVLASPAMHRWHHVKEGRGVGTNFASVFSIFDRVFGTYYCPGPCDQPTGVCGADSNRFLSQWIRPFLQPLKSFRSRDERPATREPQRNR